MAEPADVMAAVQRAEDLEAIRRLKYRCLRCVDTKQWDGLADCFTDDATLSHEGGKYSLQGRDAILDFFRGMNVPELITMHQVHHPEIEIMAPGAARATWAMEDYVIDLKANWSLYGAAFCEDEYIVIEGHWRIQHTGFKRIFWERWDRGEMKSLRLIESMHGINRGAPAGPRHKPARRR